VLYHIFDEFNEDWKKKSTLYKALDTSVEISLLAIIAFWSEHIIDFWTPFFPVRKSLDRIVDSYVSGIFYVFAVFVFMESLTEKLRFLFDEMLGKHFESIFPKYGSLLNFTLSYTPLTKTEKSKL
jgi:hypothetical protein